ncbi:MAG: molybdopterin dinucleotide binding domain-containing protein, partial [Pseudomonadota bacterium]
TSFTDQINDHRTLIDGHYYWILRMNADDARDRGIQHRDLIKIYNNRGAVICAADTSSLVARGVVKSYQSSAKFNLLVVNGETVEIGGCLNMLTPDRFQTSGVHSMSPNSTLVEVMKYDHLLELNEARAA